MEKKQSIFKKVKPYKGNKGMLLFIAMFFSAGSGVMLLMPMIYIHKIFRHIILTQVVDMDFIINNSIYSILFALGGVLLYVLSGICSHIFAFEVEEKIIKINFNKLINKPLGYYTNKESGAIRTIISDGATQTHNFLAHQLPDFAITLVMPIFLLVLFFVFDWKLGLISLVPIFIGFILMSTIMTKKMKKIRETYFSTLSHLGAETVEYVRCIPVVKTFNTSIESFNKLNLLIQKIKKVSMEMTLGYRNKYTAFEAIIGSTALFLVPIAIMLIQNGGDIRGILANSIIYLLIGPMFGVFLLRIATISQNSYIAGLSIDNIDELLKYNDMEFGKEKNKGTDIEFNNVSFGYENEKVIKNISFKINKGETVALVGASGGGKSTIARLAARFYDPQEGIINIGGINIKEYTKNDLMDKISFIFQKSKLFKMSLKDNLLLGKPDATDKEIKNVLKKSCLNDFVNNLKDGLDTIYGTKGTYISGGEAQRFILARALLKDAEILIFDEATAFIDPETEHLIQQTFKELAKNKTTLLIAHRMSTVVNADRIIVVDDGKILEEGNHNELLEQKGIYSKLWDEYQKSIQWNIGGNN